MPRLSVIVTFYDETAFVKMAIGSVLSQPVDDIEIIIVNDNPDQFTSDYFDGLHLSDTVKVIHHPHNKGLSAARNTGIQASSGALVGFLDADDYYTSKGLARQLGLAESSGADVTHAACYLSRSGSPEVDVLRRDKLMFSAPRSGEGLIEFEEAQFFTSSWSSLYRRDFLDAFNLRFDEDQPKFEDRLFVLQTVTAARRIVTLGAPTRVWRQRTGSISVTKTDPYIHRLQIQLIEKCLSHMRGRVAAGRLPPRFEKRELFNTVGRLIWDMDVIDPIVAASDPAYADFAERIVTLLADDAFGNAIFEDETLKPISRVGMRTRKGFIGRVTFFELHKALRDGDFAHVQRLLEDTRKGRANQRPPLADPLEADLILHLGLHKTGSTFLQHHLTHYRDALLERGILLPASGLKGVTEDPIRPGSFPGHQVLIQAMRDPERLDTWRELAQEVTASGASTVVLTCENMLFPLNRDRDDLLATLIGHLSMFRSVRCLAYVRRPDTYIEALYKEIVANGRRMGSRSIQEFMVDHAALLTDLPALFAPFEDMGGAPVQLLDFDGAVASGTLWPQFCTALGLTQDKMSDLVTIDAPTYPSPDRNGTQAARVINTLISDEGERQQILGDLFRSLPTPETRHAILSPAERLAIIDRFQDTSAAFAADRGYRPDYHQMRASVPEQWEPPTGLDAPTLAALQDARLRAERPITAPNTDTKRPRKSTKRDTSGPTLITLRIKPRPWVLSLLKWRPFGK